MQPTTAPPYISTIDISRALASPGAACRSPLLTMTELTRPAFLILLALVERDLHGLGIADSVAQTTGGTVDLGPGTLYRTLRLLAESGWIREARAPSSDADPRRKYYAITAEGRRRAITEAEQLSRIARVARERRLIPGRA